MNTKIWKDRSEVENSRNKATRNIVNVWQETCAIVSLLPSTIDIKRITF